MMGCIKGLGNHESHDAKAFIYIHLLWRHSAASALRLFGARSCVTLGGLGIVLVARIVGVSFGRRNLHLCVLGLKN